MHPYIVIPCAVGLITAAILGISPIKLIVGVVAMVSALWLVAACG